jgi:hypothetical protein
MQQGARYQGFHSGFLSPAPFRWLRWAPSPRRQALPLDPMDRNHVSGWEWDGLRRICEKATARGGRTVLDSPIGDIPNTCAPPDDVQLNCPDAPENVPHAWPLDQACPDMKPGLRLIVVAVESTSRLMRRIIAFPLHPAHLEAKRSARFARGGKGKGDTR